MDRDLLSRRILSLRGDLEEAGVTHLAMFGSRARGDHRPDSDVDVLIDVQADRKFSLIDLAGVELTLCDAIGLPVQVTMRRSLRPRFADEIRRDIVDVF